MLKTIFIILFYLLLCNCSDGFSQANVEWFRTYNHPIPYSYSDHAEDMVEDNLGNVYVTGTSFGTGDDWRYDFATIKYNSNGLEQWVKRYNYFSEDYPKSIKIDFQNNVYVAGTSKDSSIGYSIALIKYDSDGNQLWVKRYNDTINYDINFSDMIIDEYNNILITGYLWGHSRQFGLIIKYNPNGELQWSVKYAEPEKKYIFFTSVCSDKENIYVTGFTMDPINSKTDYIIVKYNLSGIKQWETITDLTFSDIGNSIVTDENDNIYVSGYSSSSKNLYDMKLISYNSFGNIQYIRSLPGLIDTSTPWGYSPKMLKIDRSKNIIVNFMTYRNEYFNDIAVAKYSPDGDLKWFTRYSYNNTSYESTRDMRVDSTGNVYVTGFSQFDSSYNNFVILKYDSNSVLQNIIRNENQFSYYFYPAAMNVNSSGNVTLTGAGNLYDDFSDFFTIKYSQSVGIQNISSEIPGNFNLYQNYPNPFNPKTIIRFDVIPLNLPFEKGGTGGFVLLKVYDILGNEVRSLVNEKKSAGTYEIDFDGNDLSSGVYYYKLSAGNFSRTKRMVLLK